MRSRFPIVELGKHVRQVSQRNRAEANIEVFSVTNSDGFTRSTDYFSKEVFSKDVSNYKIVNPGQFAYNPSRINVGSIDYLRHGSAVLVSPLYIVFEGNKDIHADYLLRYLKSDWGNAQVRANTEGAVRDSLKFKGLESIKLPLPLIDDQIRIALLLGKVEGLIAQRKQHLQQLDDLLKSVFLEMFGDPILNPHAFPVRKLSEFYVNPKEGTKCGPFGSALKKEELVDSGVPVWNMDNIGADGRMVLPFRMWITAEKYDELSAYSVQDGDIIISRAGTVGKMCVARMDGRPAIISTNLIRLRLGTDLRPLHFVSLMLYCKGRVGRLKTGADGAFTHMNTGVLDSLEFPYPPVDLQDRFAAIANKVEIAKSSYQQSITDLEALYGALSQQAFKGELDLTRIEFPQSPPVEALPKDTSLGMAAPMTTLIKLPELPAELTLSGKGRQAALQYWFQAALKSVPKGGALQIDKLIDAINFRLIAMDDQDIEFSSADYEVLKFWIFEALSAGTLTQALDEAGNRIELKAAQA